LLRSPGYKAKIIQIILQQHREGIDGTGKQLQSQSRSAQLFDTAYSLFTIEKRKEKGLQTEVVDLYFEGDFYASHNVILVGDAFEITANTLKDDNDLLEVWGEDILSLTDENLQLVIEITKEVAIKWLKEILLS